VRLRGERIVGREREGVAVGFRLDEVADAEGPGRTALVVDDDGLSKRLGNLDLQRSGHDVGVSAGRERHDDVDGPRRIGLSRRRAGVGNADGGAREGEQNHWFPGHDFPSTCPRCDRLPTGTRCCRTRSVASRSQLAGPPRCPRAQHTALRRWSDSRIA
jgi:hypothetical protein